MNKEQFFSEIEEYLEVADIERATKKISSLLGGLPDFDASKQVTELLFSQYSRYGAGYIASIMEAIIKKNPNWAQVNHPENFLFKLCVITGSKDLYECYVEEAAEPFLTNKNQEDKELYYLDLYTTAVKLTDFFFPEYNQCIKGMDYNGAFSSLDDSENVLLINKEDYDIMEKVVEDYNRIIGRRDIVKDLESRMNGE